jgi:hypothetical protein
MLDIEVVIVIRETGLPSGNTAIQINENLDYAKEPSAVRLLANRAVSRAEAALLSEPRPESMPE